MLKYLSSITTTLILGLSPVTVYAGDWDWLIDAFRDKCAEYPNCPILDHSVPELSVATGPIAVAVILGIVGIGLERRRRKNNI